MVQGLDEVTVLAVDDGPGTLGRYERLLDGRFALRTASTGEDALAALDEDIDVVLLDRDLPDLPGEVVLSRIRDRAPDCRVAMVTDEDPDFDVVSMGFDGSLVRPVSAAELRATVDRLLRRVDYDEGLRELYALCSRRADLETERAGRDPEDGEYRSLTAEIDHLRAETDRTVDSFDAMDFEAAFRDLAEWTGDE